MVRDVDHADGAIFSVVQHGHAAGLSDAQNRELYGKCNNPFGHGHDYTLDVSLRGPVDQGNLRCVLQTLRQAP